jgi:hypothetical protein
MVYGFENQYFACFIALASGKQMKNLIDSPDSALI